MSSTGVPPRILGTSKIADRGSWCPNRDPRTRACCCLLVLFLFVLYPLALELQSLQERNGLTEGNCSPTYGEEDAESPIWVPDRLIRPAKGNGHPSPTPKEAEPPDNAEPGQKDQGDLPGAENETTPDADVDAA